jgi:DNA integrity scanning protein DisA with diadenylate cyclase activity
MSGALAMVAPGQPLRDGLDRILRAKRGGLVVIGDGPDVLSICSGGFLLDSEFSPQRLSELAKMDGAIIIASDASRIARANVHLMPDAAIPTTETGTRHRTAERVARSIDVPILSVSAAMSVIAVYRNDLKHTIQPTGWLHDRTDQALATMQRFRSRFDAALGNLCILEVEDTVSVGDVVHVIQAAEMVLRIGEEVDGYLVELGVDGRLVGLQSAELVDGVARALDLVVRDYCVMSPKEPPTVPPSRSRSSSSWPICRRTGCATRTGWRRSCGYRRTSTTPSPASSPAATGSCTTCPGCRTRSSSGSSAGSSTCNTSCAPRWPSSSKWRGSARPGPPRSRRAWPAWLRPASSSATSRHPEGVPTPGDPHGEPSP